MSKIHCIMLTKNEADVVSLCLREAAKWADFIYVYDNQSDDGTWDIVRSLKSDKIIPWKQHNKNYSDGIRADVFNEFRHLSYEGDWWMKLDADEFYNPSLRQQLQQVPPGHHMVWAITLDFQITFKDLQELDFQAPIEEVLGNLRYYKAAYSEPRIFRYRRRLVWNAAGSWPKHAGVVARDRPLFRHYPHRSPKQIQKRLDLRRAARAGGFKGWDHASQANWKEKIVDHSECQFDDGSGRFVVDETRLPRHLEPVPRRLLKFLLQKSGIWP